MRFTTEQEQEVKLNLKVFEEEEELKVISGTV